MALEWRISSKREELLERTTEAVFVSRCPVRTMEATGVSKVEVLSIADAVSALSEK